MANYHDPARVTQDFLAVVKLWHTVDGLYIWEFITSLNYEWSVIRGRRPYRWTIWVYSLTRVATLLAIIINMIGFDAMSPINCQAWVISELITSFTAVAAGSMLIALRTVAIWERNKIVVGLVSVVWLTNVGFLINSVPRLRSTWVPVLNTCTVVHTDTGRFNIVATLSTDVILLLIMLVRLFRMRFSAYAFSFARFLWTQGAMWLLIAILAQVPSVVCVYLNLNDPFNMMFQTPALITNTIAATRMYRALADFSSPMGNIPPSQTMSGSTAKRGFPGPIELNRMEVAVHTDCEQYPESQTGNYSLYVSKEGKLCDKPQGLGVNNDVESAGEK